MVGGIAGGLFQFFNFIGEVFFSLLIGGQGANRPNLRRDRVSVGSCLIFIPAIVLIFIIKWDDWLIIEGKPWPFYGVLLLSIPTGVIVGLLIASILLSYVEAVERDIEEEERQNQRYTKKYSELIAKGVKPSEAAEQAKSYASGSDSPCFIATAVYGSSNTEEVTYLRQWRDDCLLHSFVGRILVGTYYFISPRIVHIFGRSGFLKVITKAVIDRLIFIIKTWRINS